MCHSHDLVLSYSLSELALFELIVIIVTPGLARIPHVLSNQIPEFSLARKFFGSDLLTFDQPLILETAMCPVMTDGEDRAATETKKVNLRRAHRASATRLATQIDEALGSGGTLKLARQLKQSLTMKLDILTGCDGAD